MVSSRPNIQHSAVPFHNLVSLINADFFPKVVTSEIWQIKDTHGWKNHSFDKKMLTSLMAKMLTARFLRQSTLAKAYKITRWLDWGRKVHNDKLSTNSTNSPNTNSPNSRMSFRWSLVQEYGPQELAQVIFQLQSVNYWKDLRIEVCYHEKMSTAKKLDCANKNSVS